MDKSQFQFHCERSVSSREKIIYQNSHIMKTEHVNCNVFFLNQIIEKILKSKNQTFFMLFGKKICFLY
jgi:hypothetical protein